MTQAAAHAASLPDFLTTEMINPVDRRGMNEADMRRIGTASKRGDLLGITGVEFRDVSGNVVPLIDEFPGAPGEPLDVVILGNHDHPTECRHDAKNADYDPRIQGDRFDKESENSQILKKMER